VVRGGGAYLRAFTRQVHPLLDTALLDIGHHCPCQVLLPARSLRPNRLVPLVFLPNAILHSRFPP
jgi:hypothetical protein